MDIPIKENEVLNDLLGYEGLKIIQAPGRFNFSLDSTLLAHFVTLRKDSKKILDLCTGNAPIPLILTLRTKGDIVGVEIQTDSADQAKRSVAINGLEGQIKIMNEDLNQLHTHFKPGSFDVITCNPPYFEVGLKSNLNKNDALTIARHEVMATLDDVVCKAAYFLRPGGRFAMVHRPDRLVEIIETFKRYRLEPKRLRFIYPRFNRQANGMLIEGVLDGKRGGLHLESPLVVYETVGSNYTQEILDIFHMQKNF